jgi:hypothetical protein
MEALKHFIQLNEQAVLRLPYSGPLSRRIYVVLQEDGKMVTRELFVQKSDAFAINLVELINRLRNHEIFEIRYSCGLDGFVRIFINEKGRLAGEYFCKSKKSLDSLKERLKM